MDSILSFLHDIPSVFNRDEGIKDLSHHSFKEKEKKFAVQFVSVFRIDGTKFCSDYRITYRTFKSWKESFTTELDVLSLLKCPIPPKDAKPIHSMSVQCTPTVCSQSTQTDFTSSSPHSVINRRKEFSDLCMRMQKKTVLDTFSSLPKIMRELPSLIGFSEADKYLILKKAILRMGTNELDSYNLRSLLNTFKTSLMISFQSRDSRNIALLLSLLFPTFTLKTINLYLNNFHISPYYWNTANRYGRIYGSAIITDLSFNRSNCRVSNLLIQQTVSFIFEGNYYKPTAYGTHNSKLSSGEKITLPNYCRIGTKKKIWKEYLSTSLPIQGKVPKKIFYQILDTIGTEADCLLAALDTASLKLGADNFELISELLETVVSNDVKKVTLQRQLKQIRQYLKDGFRSHLEENGAFSCCNYPNIFGENHQSCTLSCCKECLSIIEFFGGRFRRQRRQVTICNKKKKEEEEKEDHPLNKKK
jgi:hypothetical protein